MITRPLLAGKCELGKLEYPVLATPKLDGIRALFLNGKLVSRNFKPIPNKYICKTIKDIATHGLDGELMLYHCGDFNEVQSAVMSRDGEPDFFFAVFDYVKDSLDTPYSKRMENLHTFRRSLSKPQRRLIKGVYPTELRNERELHDFEEAMLGAGHEGIMLRRPDGPYKCGRSTTNQGILLKLKRFQDAEAVVVDFEELYHNDNELKRNAFGLVERSHKKANLKGMDTLGALIVRLEDGTQFALGTGFTQEQRDYIWKYKKKHYKKHAKFKYQELSKDGVPRFPVFLGFRELI